MTLLGTSPRFLAEIQGRGISPRMSPILHHCYSGDLKKGQTVKIGKFDALKTITCTGAVLTTPMFEWTQNAFGKNVHVVSTSGGTDVCTACMSAAVSLYRIKFDLSTKL